MQTNILFPPLSSFSRRFATGVMVWFTSNLTVALTLLPVQLLPAAKLGAPAGLAAGAARLPAPGSGSAQPAARRWGSVLDRRCSAQSHAWAKRLPATQLSPPGARGSAHGGLRGCRGPWRPHHCTVIVEEARLPAQPCCPPASGPMPGFFAGEPQGAAAVAFSSSDSLLFPAGTDLRNEQLLPISSSPPPPFLFPGCR